MREIVHLAVGQCGNQIGAKVNNHFSQNAASRNKNHPIKSEVPIAKVSLTQSLYLTLNGRFDCDGFRYPTGIKVGVEVAQACFETCWTAMRHEACKVLAQSLKQLKALIVYFLTRCISFVGLE